MAAVSIRYARALADVIADAKLDPPKAVAQLCSLVIAFVESRELREVWESPAITVEAEASGLGCTGRPDWRHGSSGAQLHRRAHR